MARWLSTSSVSDLLTDTAQARRGGDAAADELAGVDEQARADAFLEAAGLQVAHLLAELGEVHRHLERRAALVRDDLRLLVARRVVEVDGDEALAGRVLQVLEHALVAGVVGDHEQEVGMRLDDLAALVDRQDAAVVGERVDEDGGVLARLDDLVEVAERAEPHGLRERAVDPDRLVALDQIAADEIAAGEILVAGDGDQVAGHAVRAVAAQRVRHVLDEARLAAAGRALEQDGRRHA